MQPNAYKTLILNHPKKVLLVIILLTLFLGSFATKLKIDASAETLLLENDKDLQLSREIAARYATSDFLLVAFSPKSNDLLDKQSLDKIQEFSNEVQKLPLVKDTTSILTVPLLQSPPIPIKELINNIPTLQSGNVDKQLAQKEFLNNPLYSNSLVSKDFKTTAILINLKDDKKFQDLIKKREKLKEEKNLQELQLVENELKSHRDMMREANHQNIVQVRKIIEKYEDFAIMHLGGVTMIADDITTYVQNDLQTFGIVVFILLVLILTFLFRSPRWVLLPIFICIMGVISTTGLLGLFGWEITVISSNFISLQLIMNMSLVIHLVIKYKELHYKFPSHNQKQLLYDTTSSMLKPSFFVVITTITGFSSLVFSNILPVINFGWMMSMAISLSLVYTFILFPTVLMLLPKEPHNPRKQNKISFTKHLSTIAQEYKLLIMTGMIITIVFSVSGAQKLFVENSFIDYFKQNTQIYQGMKVIDTQLGGTTPLDVVITFKEDDSVASVEVDSQDSFADDMLNEFESEFVTDTNDEQYWFTAAKMQKVEQVHKYLESLPQIGKVLSLATLGELGRMINDGEDLDSLTLALMYQKLPAEYKKIILDPYMNIEANQLRITMRVIDSQENLRRDALIKKIKKDVSTILNPKYEEFALTNIMVLYNNMLQSLFNSQIKTLGVVVAVLFIMFLVLFRSLSVAVIAIIANIVPVGVIFGFMGWIHIPLDIMTITIAAISIGIAVDNTIHYIHRFEIELKNTNNYEKSVKISHSNIGKAMFYTALIIMVGFSVLVLSNFIPTIYFGLLTIIAMFMAIVADLLLLPTMLLLFKPIKIN